MIDFNNNDKKTTSIASIEVSKQSCPPKLAITPSSDLEGEIEGIYLVNKL